MRGIAVDPPAMEKTSLTTLVPARWGVEYIIDDMYHSCACSSAK